MSIVVLRVCHVTRESGAARGGERCAGPGILYEGKALAMLLISFLDFACMRFMMRSTSFWVNNAHDPATRYTRISEAPLAFPPLGAFSTTLEPVLTVLSRRFARMGRKVVISPSGRGSGQSWVRETN